MIPDSGGLKQEKGRFGSVLIAPALAKGGLSGNIVSSGGRSMSDDITDIGSSPVQPELGFGAISLPSSSTDEYAKILSMTKRIFPGAVEVCRKEDPDYAEEYFAIKVTCKGAFEDIMARDSQWHRECRQIAAPSSRRLYRLRLDIQEQ
jgi:hypothetical protein